MEKKKYIKPISRVISDDMDCPLMAGSDWNEGESTAPTTTAITSNIETEVEGIYNKADIKTPSAKMHDLWEEW